MMLNVNSVCDILPPSGGGNGGEAITAPMDIHANVVVPVTMETVTSVAVEEEGPTMVELLTAEREQATASDDVPFHAAGTDYHVPRLEAATLSVMINRLSIVESAAMKLDAGDFYQEEHVRVFEALLHQRGMGRDTSPAGLLKYLSEVYPDRSADLTKVVNACAATSSNFKHLDGYIRELKKAAAIRGGKTYCPSDYNEHFCFTLLLNRMPQMRCVDQTLLRYEDGIWTEADSNMIRTAALEVIHPKHREARRVTDLLKHVEHALQVPKGTFVGGHKFAAGGHVLINANNRVLEVHPNIGIVVRDHSPDHNFTRKLQAAHDASAQCPNFMRTMAEALPDPEDRLLFQAFAGYTLYPSCEHETSLVNCGPGGTGKSTLTGAICDVVGRDLCGAAGLEELCQRGSYSLPLLRQKMLNLGSELNGTEIEESANFKKLVSGEWMNVRQIYGAPEDMQTNCKLMFNTNNKPRFRGGTDAETRRLRILPFVVKPANKDTQLKVKLREEISGILNWMLEGLLWVMANGCIPTGGKEARKTIEQFHRSNDPVGSFAAECLVFGPAETVVKSKLYDSFEEWCNLAGLPAEKLENFFYKTLLERHPGLGDTRRQIKGKREWCYVGVGLKSDAPRPGGPWSTSAPLRAKLVTSSPTQPEEND